MGLAHNELQATEVLSSNSGGGVDREVSHPHKLLTALSFTLLKTAGPSEGSNVATWIRESTQCSMRVNVFPSLPRSRAPQGHRTGFLRTGDPGEEELRSPEGFQAAVRFKLVHVAIQLGRWKCSRPRSAGVFLSQLPLLLMVSRLHRSENKALLLRGREPVLQSLHRALVVPGDQGDSGGCPDSLIPPLLPSSFRRPAIGSRPRSSTLCSDSSHSDGGVHRNSPGPGLHRRPGCTRSSERNGNKPMAVLSVLRICGPSQSLHHPY